ncbi:MAG: peptide chain release factor 2 [Candidatus Hydrogenedens sp.]|nr:peptide chain release factor 2 [Candidatus Hydrogenedens sp.]
MYEDALTAVRDYGKRLAELRKCLNVDGTKQKISELETVMSAQDFWNDPEAAQKVVQQLKGYRTAVDMPDKLHHEIEELDTLIELAREEDDASLEGDIEEHRDSIEQHLRRLEISSLFMDPRDAKVALVSIHPGAGGTESCDWASMLYRMITRYCERQEFDYEVLEYQDAEEAGLKSATLRVTGVNAYGMLKSESGVHRLVRISPFDSQARRHTSFAAIEVLTEIDEDIEIEVREEDLKMDVFRSSGAGGQKVNKTSSAVRLTHLPTGIVVSCQVERSQHQNRAVALTMLKSRLYDIEMRKKQEELDQQREGQQDVAWGSQIRSYVLHPYQMVKDLRTSAETGNITKVLDGDIDMFVEAYLKWNLSRKSGQHASA